MYDYIPIQLKELNNWCCYDARDKESYKNLSDREINNYKKCPRDLKGNVLYSWINKGFTFNECIKSIKDGFNSGIGLILKNNGIVVIDYDNCIKDVEISDKYGYTKPIFKDAITEQQITEDINNLKSYCELSPSGKGIHIILLTDIKDLWITQPIEIYSYKKFIRFSGNDVFNFDLNYANNELLELIDKYKINTSQAKQLRFNKSIYKDFLKQNFKYANGKSDNDILDILFNGKNGDFIKSLYYDSINDADYIKYKQNKINKHLKNNVISKQRQEHLLNSIDVSNSGKSYTLIMYLIDACYGDIDAVKRIFKKSALCKKDYLKPKYKEQDNKLSKIDKIDYMIKKTITGQEYNRYKNYRN